MYIILFMFRLPRVFFIKLIAYFAYSYLNY